MNPLFKGKHLSSVLEDKFNRAAREVSTFSDQVLRDPRLAGRVEELWQSMRPSVPVLRPERKTGRKRQEQRTSTDYDREIVREVTVVDVHIPFDGDPDMFDVAPSSMTVIFERFQVARDHLLYTMPLDQSQEAKLDTLLGQIVGNLATIRKEEESFSENAVKRLYQTALALKKKREGEAEEGGRFSFKVD